MKIRSAKYIQWGILALLAVFCLVQGSRIRRLHRTLETREMEWTERDFRAEYLESKLLDLQEVLDRPVTDEMVQEARNTVETALAGENLEEYLEKVKQRLMQVQ
jgi:hypothetical protein